MKTTSLLLLLFVALVPARPVVAQQRVGIVGGLNMAKLSGVDRGERIDFSSRNVLLFGGVLDLGLNKNLTLRLEPMYLEKGGEFVGSVDPEGNLPAEFRIKIATLDIPVFLKLASSATAVQPYVMAGATVGLLLNSKTSIQPALGIAGEGNTDGLIKFIDFGLGVGVGVNIPVAKSAIFVEGRYTHGLFNVADEGKASVGMFEFEFEQGLVVKTRGIQIVAGLTFPFGGY